ncbi:MAG: ThiF family adenylyltransferase, partial [Victivallaceae bacterium]|nr:ThiF family adenylyltransferase [Victivallaceae bacterium]
MSWLDREMPLIGAEGLLRLMKARILFIGVGGVGGFAAECLVRSGAMRIDFVDGDVVEDSNRNRQLVALKKTVGRAKAELMVERAREINPEGVFNAQVRQLTPEDSMMVIDYDLVVDCIDDLPTKAAILVECASRGVPVVSSMGAGGRMDPTMIQVADISKCTGCRLAKPLRNRLKEHHVTTGIRAVYSP